MTIIHRLSSRPSFAHPLSIYPLVNVHVTMENFHNYVELPEAKVPSNPMKPPFSYGCPMVFQIFHVFPTIKPLSFRPFTNPATAPLPGARMASALLLPRDPAEEFHGAEVLQG